MKKKVEKIEGDTLIISFTDDGKQKRDTVWGSSFITGAVKLKTGKNKGMYNIITKKITKISGEELPQGEYRKTKHIRRTRQQIEDDNFNVLSQYIKLEEYCKNRIDAMKKRSKDKFLIVLLSLFFLIHLLLHMLCIIE